MNKMNLSLSIITRMWIFQINLSSAYMFHISSDACHRVVGLILSDKLFYFIISISTTRFKVQEIF